ncbi:hypothetical protein JVU11DRAFT_1229 [Chiua virens]|nr:hypothetical protein JVU11DRAFT_1229 [Chiua virens]
MNMIHTLAIQFCGCSQAPHHDIRLLCTGWFPVSGERPQTAFAFNVLSHFHELILQSKTTAHDFYQTLVRQTDNAGLSKTFHGYKEFTRTVHEWQNLMCLKRGGRAHDPASIEATTPGSLAVECPACPHPGQNLPDSWDKVGIASKFLYALYLSLDTNFKLALKSRNLKDVPLTNGWLYFCKEQPFQEYVSQAGEQ